MTLGSYERKSAHVSIVAVWVLAAEEALPLVLAAEEAMPLVVVAAEPLVVLAEPLVVAVEPPVVAAEPLVVVAEAMPPPAWRRRRLRHEVAPPPRQHLGRSMSVPHEEEFHDDKPSGPHAMACFELFGIPSNVALLRRHKCHGTAHEKADRSLCRCIGCSTSRTLASRE